MNRFGLVMVLAIAAGCVAPAGSPTGADSEPARGVVVLKVSVGADGKADGVTVLSETPRGFGFGDAARSRALTLDYTKRLNRRPKVFKMTIRFDKDGRAQDGF